MSLSGDYSLIDRCLHYIAFGHPSIQKALCEIENDLFSKKFEDIVSNNEVFVTGLPRSGTTLVLDMLYRTGEFSTFTYREMPFILSPIIWSKISRSFYKEAKSKERAHGDGMQVSFDSPEAFEEVIWLSYLRKKVIKPDFLSPLGPDESNPEFVHALRNSIRKVLYLDQSHKILKGESRYLSKNNANISRIDTLLELFPNSTILVLFRNPLAHIGSLMKQHDRFLKEQSTDRFTERYMSWLGHYEFGKNFKPINFDNWLDGRDVPYEVNADFWLEYWSKTYEYVLKKKTDNVLLVDFDELVKNNEEVLTAIAERIDLRDKQSLIGQSSRLRLPQSEPIVTEACSNQVRLLAGEIHEQLKSRAVRVHY